MWCRCWQPAGLALAVCVFAGCSSKVSTHAGDAGSKTRGGAAHTSERPTDAGAVATANMSDSAGHGSSPKAAIDGGTLQSEPLDAASAMAAPPSDNLPNDDRPHTLPPEVVGVLMGPGGTNPQTGVTFYGTDVGLTYEHDGKLVIMFGDTWTTSTFICDNPDPNNDDTVGTLPLTYDGGVPKVTLITQDNAPSQVSTIQVMRGMTSLPLGSAKVPMTGFSDGTHEYAIFQRYTPTRCGPGVDPTAGVCPTDDGFQCSTRVGDCSPPYGSVDLQCDAQAMSGCYPGQTCMNASPGYCFDPSSSQYDGTLMGEVTSISQDDEIGVRRSETSTVYDSVFSFPSNKFSNLTARTVASFTGKRDGNDYSPGHGSLLVWGRPGFTAEQGRKAELYLMTHPLPLALDAQQHLEWQPQYFAGIDPQSGEPIWAAQQSRAQPLALDGVRGGSTDEQESIVDQMTVSWLPAPIDKWMMLYGGDISDLLLLDPSGARTGATPGAIMIRFADQPWGPWSSPVPHLLPGNPTHLGDPYGPGGVLFNPDCMDLLPATCAKRDPLRPGDALLPGCPVSSDTPDPGRFYGATIIDSYTRPNPDNGLDVFWNVSTWNPYSVVLMKTTVRSANGPQTKDELADPTSLERMSDWRSVPLLGDHGQYRQQTSADRGTSDTSFPLSGNGNKDFNNFICASKDAKFDPSQIAPFYFDQPTCDDDYAQGLVIGRFEGSGRLVRVWLGMASLLSGPADDEILRIYVDDDPKAKVEVPLADALSGKAGEVFAPPFGAGSPKRLAWYYPVAFRKKLVVTIDGLGPLDEYYYHCDVVLDAPPASSDPLPTERLHERDHVLAQLNARDNPVAGIAALATETELDLAAGTNQTVHFDGPATVYEFRLRTKDADLNALASVNLHVRWDGEKDDAISLALLEFLAAQRVPAERTSLALRSYVENGERIIALRLPMPFASSADVGFDNQGTMPVSFGIQLFGEPRVPASAYGHLHTQRRETLGPTTASTHLAVEAEGRGRLAGLCLLVEGHADPDGGIMTDPLDLLEADPRATIDGQLALNGTGSEEYADDIFYFTDAPQASAFVQAWGRFDDSSRKPPGQVSFCRWHVLGTELDFDSSIEFSFELGGAGNPSVVERVQSVAYLYLPD